jgi:hypothetical protein
MTDKPLPADFTTYSATSWALPNVVTGEPLLRQVLPRDRTSCSISACG